MEGLLAVDAVVVQLRQRTFVPGQVPAFPVFWVILPDILVEGAISVLQLGDLDPLGQLDLLMAENIIIPFLVEMLPDIVRLLLEFRIPPGQHTGALLHQRQGNGIDPG